MATAAAAAAAGCVAVTEQQAYEYTGCQQSTASAAAAARTCHGSYKYSIAQSWRSSITCCSCCSLVICAVMRVGQLLCAQVVQDVSEMAAIPAEQPRPTAGSQTHVPHTKASHAKLGSTIANAGGPGKSCSVVHHHTQANACCQLPAMENRFRPHTHSCTAEPYWPS